MKKLKKADKILIVAPCGHVKKNEIENSIKYIEKKGYKYEIGKNCFSKYDFGYKYAGKANDRYEDLQWALDNKDASAIWFARGGYGALHIVDMLNLDEFRKNPKWVIGYSDITIFHQFLNKNNFPTIHSIVCKELPKGYSKKAYSSLFNAITKGKVEYNLKNNISNFNQEGKVKAKISGGNLSTIYSLINSKTIDSFDDKILFIEDVCEDFYHIDRMLLAMERAQMFNKIKGLVVGSFTNMDNKKSNPNYENDYDNFTNQIISDRFKKYNIPKIFNFPSGHIPNNLAIIMGANVELEIKLNEINFKNYI